MQLTVRDLALPGHAIPLASNISFDARAGAVTQIAMPSPTAATALSLALTAHLKPVSGTIHCSDDQPLADRSIIVDSPGVNDLEDMRQAAAYAREILSYQQGRTPRDFFTHFGLTSLTEKDDRIGRKPLGIDLSAPERSHLMCALSLTDTQAEVVVFDTPYRTCTSAEDREAVTFELQQLASDGRIVIAVTHLGTEEPLQ